MSYQSSLASLALIRAVLPLLQEKPRSSGAGEALAPIAAIQHSGPGLCSSLQGCTLPQTQAFGWVSSAMPWPTNLRGPATAHITLV